MAVNEKTGEIVQVTEGGYTGMLNIARKSMKLYFMRNSKTDTIPTTPGDTMSPDGTKLEIQSAMLSADNRTMNICIIPVPEQWLKRTYK